MLQYEGGRKLMIEHLFLPKEKNNLREMYKGQVSEDLRLFANGQGEDVYVVHYYGN
jgi:hypothetical protein